MLVIVTESIPERLRGYLSRLLLEVRAGVFIGQYSVRVREMLVKTIMGNIEEGNVVVAWSANNESGFDFETIGKNRRLPVQFDGLKLISFFPDEEARQTEMKAISCSLTSKGKGKNQGANSVDFVEPPN